MAMVLALTLYAQQETIATPKNVNVHEMEPPITSVSVDKEIHDFGYIPEASKNDVVFSIKNTGDVPLIITKAKGSCSCTVPFFPQVPIMPGDSSEIHAVFKPKPSQNGKNITQVISVFGNIPDGVMRIKVKANVLMPEEYVEDESFIKQAEQNENDKEVVEELKPGCFVIFPNPTSNELQLDLKQYIGLSATVNIHDEFGKDVFSESIPSISSATTRFDVSGYPSGIYIISILVDGKNPMSQCFVVTN